MILVYIWFRFEWQFAVGAVVTLILDITKAIGFLAITRIEFDLVMVAAILTILGYSTNDKVVVYDRVRENLRKYKTMPLRELIDLSINETLNRTLGTSMTVFLASLPLALFGGESISGFAWVMLFGIVVGTSSSIFIAAPILLFLGEHRLRREATPAAVPVVRPCIRRRDRSPAPADSAAAALAPRAAWRGLETVTLLVGAKAGSQADAAGARLRPVPRPPSAGHRHRDQQRRRRCRAGRDARRWRRPNRPVPRSAGSRRRRCRPAWSIAAPMTCCSGSSLIGAVQKEPIAIVSPAATPLELGAGHRGACGRRCRSGAARHAAGGQSAASGGTAAAGAGRHAAQYRGVSLGRRGAPGRGGAATSPPPRSACPARSAICATGGWSVWASPPPTGPTPSPTCRRCATQGWTCPR